MKLPYEQVSEQADLILMKMLDPNADQAAIYEDYQDWLRAAGWSEGEFNAETMRRVDADWDDKKPAKTPDIKMSN
jgi:hypothetical protein